MLVKPIQDFKDYTEIQRIAAGRLFIVYATEHDPLHGEEYSILPADSPANATPEDDEPNPIFYSANNFEVVSDKVSQSWVTKKVLTARGLTEYASPPEWFDDNFYVRAHDWGLEGKDYKIINMYNQKYDELYHDFISGPLHQP